MCGRFTLGSPIEALEALFELDAADWNDPRYNIAPQTRIVTVRGRRGHRQAQSLLWGAANPRGGRPLINARSETAAGSPFFAGPFATGRVLVPADGFYEWVLTGDARQARYFQRPGLGPFAFAGLRLPAGLGPEGRESAAVILTTAASPSVAEVHDRMPVVIEREDFDTWLDRATGIERVRDLMDGAAAAEWVSHPVGPFVNNVRHDGPENIRPVAPAVERQTRLF